jgi:hypothetical protein
MGLMFVLVSSLDLRRFLTRRVQRRCRAHQSNVCDNPLSFALAIIDARQDDVIGAEPVLVDQAGQNDSRR